MYAGLTVNGNAVALPAGSGAYAAIDTGTTLVTGPPSVIDALYAQIPNSQALTGDAEGFYQFRESPRLLSPSFARTCGSDTLSLPHSMRDRRPSRDALRRQRDLVAHLARGLCRRDRARARDVHRRVHRAQHGRDVRAVLHRR